MDALLKYFGGTWLGSKITSPVFRKYFQNVSWLIFEKVFTLFVALIVNIYVAKYLHPENFGLLNYAISFVGIFAAFTTLGLDQILVRELTKHPEEKNRILGTGLILKLSGAGLLGILMLVVLPFMNNLALTNVLILIIASAELFKCFDVINNYYQSRVESRYVVKVQLIVNLLSSVIKLFFVYYGLPLVFFAWLVLFNAFLNALGYLLNYLQRDGSVFKWRSEKSLALRLLRESWPIAIHGIALLTQSRIDQVMIGKMINNSAVGQYSVALRFIEIFSFVPIVLLNTFLPAVTRAKEAGQALYQNRLVNLYRLMFLMFIVVAVPIFLFGRQFIVALYGAEYEPAGILLSLFAIRLFFTNMGVAKSVFTVNESLFRFSLLTTIIGAVMNITINYFLIPVYGAYGAIVATVVSFTVSDFLVDLFYGVTRENQKLIFKGVLSFWKLNEVFVKP
jgi:O-antigen/teichoic acid export membrane protein